MNKKANGYIHLLNSFLFSSIQMLLYVTIPFISEKTQIPNHHLSASISIGSLLLAFSGPFLSFLSDRIGRTRILSLSLFGLALSFILLSIILIFSSSFNLNVKIFLIYISRIIFGLLASAIVPVTQAILLDENKAKSNLRTLTKNSMALNLGRIVAPILVLLQFMNHEYLILSLTILVFILAVNHFKQSLNSTQIIKNDDDFKYSDFYKIFLESKLAVFLAIFYTGFIGIMQATLGNHLKTLFNIRGQEATLIMAQILLVISILGFLFQYISQKIKLNWVTMLNTGAFTLIIGAFLLNYAETLKLVWCSIIIVSIGLSFIPPVYLNLISKKTNDKSYYGSKIGIASIAHSLGYAFGTGLSALSLKLNLFSITITIILVSGLVGLITTLLNQNKEQYA